VFGVPDVRVVCMGGDFAGLQLQEPEQSLSQVKVGTVLFYQRVPGAEVERVEVRYRILNSVCCCRDCAIIVASSSIASPGHRIVPTTSRRVGIFHG